ncbi:hypothetical protein PVAND_012234 [Polypedilum vanderplanki]|uniref:Proteasome assembly chaperone 2 n=1 Tax=Polypedilum vanderplanki TaxID=319348 RepID=A0A9J6CLT0_POLVA|nr:hypothetical protein PVAND_012234 [Polypedilum vanderplanki]
MTIKKLKQIDLNGFKLLIATASTANLGQFVADLLVNSLQLEKIALISHLAIPPLIGPSAYEYSKNDVTTASEVFVHEKEKFAILLVRTPISAAFLNEFISEIIQFIKEEKFSEIIQLSSAFSSEQHFVDRNPYEYLANDFYPVENLATQFNKSSIEKVYGSGIALKLHEQATLNEIPSVILYKFTSEGENTQESVDFCTKVSSYILKDCKIDVKIPSSWKNLFGFDVNAEIY